MRPWLLLVVAAPALADITPGNWEIQVSAAMAGKPPANMAQTQCLRAEDAKDPGKLFGAPGTGCQFLNVKDDGRVHRFDLLCNQGGANLSGSGEVRYGPEALEGEMTLRTVLGNQTLDLRSKIQARRLGPCN